MAAAVTNNTINTYTPQYSSQGSGTMTNKSYNSKKCVFLIKEQSTQKNKCINREFILTSDYNIITGQFISTNWFNIHVNVKQDFECMFAWVQDYTPTNTIERMVNMGDYNELYKYEKVTISSHDLTTSFNSLMNCSHERCSPSTYISSTTHEASQTGFVKFDFNVRITKPSVHDRENDYLLLSLPNFT